MKALPFLRILCQSALFAILVSASGAQAAYSCNVSVSSVGVLYVQGGGNRVDAVGSVTLNCTRDVLLDASTLTYRIKASNGLNFNGDRRVRRGATADYLVYTLRRGTLGGGGVCNDINDWFAPATGATNVFVGTLDFLAGATASVTWGYCARVRGNQGAPASGVYTDTIQVFAQYPNNDAGALTATAAMSYTVGVDPQCVFNTFPTSMTFNYTSFSPTAQTVARNFNLRCSNGQTWTASIAPAAGVLLGLNYTMVPSPAVLTTGTGADQVVTITGTIPAGQAGTCATAQPTATPCTATQPTTVTITY